MRSEGGRRRGEGRRLAAAACLVLLAACGTDEPLPVGPGEPDTEQPVSAATESGSLDAELRGYLAAQGYSGRVASTLESRLGRPVDRGLANLGRMLWFDRILGLNGDNACAGCHSPTNGFGDTQSIAIGIDNNGIVGPDRRGPRNQRRTPMAINTTFYPTLMWNSRFRSLSGDPFDNTAGFLFPAPEGTSLSHLPHLLAAQAFIPPTERTEAAGFHFPGTNDDIRREVLRRLNGIGRYRRLFGRAFATVRAGGAITFDNVGQAIAEFEFSLVFADAPIDRYARGDTRALTESQKRGAVLFFGRAGCVRCHAVSGRSNEMYSDFDQHVIGVPQLAPLATNVAFDGPGANEDFGLEQVTGDPVDRYRFRTSPLRNVALQPTFMHNGAFVRLEDALRYHLDPARHASEYRSSALAADLRGSLGPIAPVLAHLDPALRAPVTVTEPELSDLVAFVGEGLLDPAARPARLRHLVPEVLPSGAPSLTFEFR